jgi:hypothetical protein
MGDDQYVGKDDRRIEAIAPNGLQGHLDRQIRGKAEVQKTRGLAARLPVFGKVTSGLAHQPDRWAGRHLAGKGAKQQLIGR